MWGGGWGVEEPVVYPRHGGAAPPSQLPPPREAGEPGAAGRPLPPGVFLLPMAWVPQPCAGVSLPLSSSNSLPTLDTTHSGPTLFHMMRPLPPAQAPNRGAKAVACDILFFAAFAAVHFSYFFLTVCANRTCSPLRSCAVGSHGMLGDRIGPSFKAQPQTHCSPFF